MAAGLLRRASHPRRRRHVAHSRAVATRRAITTCVWEDVRVDLVWRVGFEAAGGSGDDSEE